MKMTNSGNSKPNEEMGFFNLSSSEITGENREIECQIEKKLKKYELTINRLENICRVTNSKFLFVGNCEFETSSFSQKFEALLSKYGKIIDIVIPPKRPYVFVIYEEEISSELAIKDLQSKKVTIDQKPFVFYLFPVNTVPEFSFSKSEFKEIYEHPEGLDYLENYVEESFEKEIFDFITAQELDACQSKEKHFGYIFDNNSFQKLSDDENKIPLLFEEFFKKLLIKKLIETRPNQMTVNVNDSEHDIEHNHSLSTYDEYTVYLNFMSSVTMEFYNKKQKLMFKIHLKPNSVLILRGASRHEWTHLISNRKHDIVKDSNGNTFISKRSKRICFIFRKINSNNVQPKIDEPHMNLPTNDSEARLFEKSYVHTIYNEIADHFSQTRHTPWPGVVKFIQSMHSNAWMCDIGCGNGKYLNQRKDVYCFGCDYSDQLIKICSERNFNCFVSDCLRIPCKDDFLDYVLCIAVLHHLSTQERRAQAIKEMCRILKLGGRALITVWAKEQKHKEKESIYISRNPKKDEKSVGNETSAEIKDTNIHKFGNEFQKKDVFVSWKYNPASSNKKLSKSKNMNNPETNLTNTNESKTEINKTYLRFYHVFECQELENLFKGIENVSIIESYYEQGNWCVIFEKISK